MPPDVETVLTMADPVVTTTPAPPAPGALPVPTPIPVPNALPPTASVPVPVPGAVPAPPVTPAPVVPETYDLKLPEKAVLDAPAVERSAAFAKAHGLTQEAAQKTLEHTNAEVAAYVDAQQAAFAKMGDAWVDVVKADPELGGANFDTTILQSKAAIDRFATPEFKKALSETKFGNHPELVRCFAKIGKAMANDGIVRPTGPGPAPLSSGDRFSDMASRLYGGETTK